MEAVPDGKWSSPVEIDPFNVSIEEKVDLLLRANAAALGVQGARFVNSTIQSTRLGKTFASTDGSYIEQTLYRSLPRMTITAVNPAGGDSEPSARVVAGFAPEHWYVTLFYVVSVIAVGFHLRHGIWSAFRTLGQQSARGQRIARAVALAVSLVLTAGFLSVPFAVTTGLVG